MSKSSKIKFGILSRISKIDPVLLGILVSVSLFFFLSFMLHHPETVPSNYSDIVSIYRRPNVAGQKMPYIDFTFEYPVVSGILVYLASLTGSENSYYLVIGFFLYLSALGSTVVIYKMLKERKMDINRIFLFCIVTFSFIFFSVYTFDWVGIFLGLLSIYFFTKKRMVLSAIFLGLAIAARLIPALFLLVFVPNIKEWRKRALFLSVVVIAWLIPNSYFMVKNFDGWFATYSFQYEWGIENSFLTFFFPRMAPASHYASILLMLMFTILILKMKLYKNVLLGCLAFTLAFMISSYKVPPQYALMLLPFLTLIPIVKLPLFHVSDFLNLMIIQMWFTPFFAGEDALSPMSPVQWVNLLRQAMWAIFLVMIFKNRKSLIRSSS